MKFQYSLNDGAHFLMSATDMSDLLDVMHGRAAINKDRRDGVPVHRANDLVRQLERGLTDLEREIELSLTEIRERRASRDLENDLADDLAGWEPADD
jgi:hypothetical protein|tara:strand:- start:90 stop:380 length:291 start_codon:yes stop_codon:yes gene_type:complete